MQLDKIEAIAGVGEIGAGCEHFADVHARLIGRENLSLMGSLGKDPIGFTGRNTIGLLPQAVFKRQGSILLLCVIGNIIHGAAFSVRQNDRFTLRRKLETHRAFMEIHRFPFTGSKCEVLRQAPFEGLGGVVGQVPP